MEPMRRLRERAAAGAPSDTWLNVIDAQKLLCYSRASTGVLRRNKTRQKLGRTAKRYSQSSPPCLLCMWRKTAFSALFYSDCCV